LHPNKTIHYYTLKKTDKTTMKKAIIVHGGIIKNSGFLQILYQKEMFL